MTEEQMTNAGIFKRMSVEFLWGVACVLVLLGTSYGVLSSSVEKVQEVAQANSANVNAVKDDISKIKTDVEVIKTKIESNQQQYLEQVRQSRAELEISNRKLDLILRKIEQ